MPPLSATSRSLAVRRGAAGPLDRMTFADPENREYFHELIFFTESVTMLGEE